MEVRQADSKADNPEAVHDQVESRNQYQYPLPELGMESPENPPILTYSGELSGPSVL